MEELHKKYNRRDFLKIAGISTAASSVILPGCGTKVKSDLGLNASDPVPTDKMTYRKLPGTKNNISLLGFGCMRWPTHRSPDSRGDLIDQEAVNKLVDYALEHGVNYFDTAPVYVQGWSEKATGIALKRHPRDKFFLATKMSNFMNHTAENSLAMYKQSFRDLQTDYLDYYLLHMIGFGGIKGYKARYVDNGMLDFLLKEREAGRIRNLGFSFHGEVEAYDYALSTHDKVHWDFVQIQMNYADWNHASGINVNAGYLYGELAKRQIPVVIMEPLLGGRLSNVPRKVVAHLKERSPESSIASWAFRFAGSHEHVMTVLSGMILMDHLQNNIRTYSPLVPLTDDEKVFLDGTAQMILQYPVIPCNDCKYCMPCPYGIDIPAVLTHYNKCVNEDNLPKKKEDENYNRARRAFLVGYDNSVPKLRQANHCTGCDQCSEHCPQGIRIPQEMKRIDEFIEQLKQGTLA